MTKVNECKNYYSGSIYSVNREEKAFTYRKEITPEGEKIIILRYSFVNSPFLKWTPDTAMLSAVSCSFHNKEDAKLSLIVNFPKEIPFRRGKRQELVESMLPASCTRRDYICEWSTAVLSIVNKAYFMKKRNTAAAGFNETNFMLIVLCNSVACGRLRKHGRQKDYLLALLFMMTFL